MSKLTNLKKGIVGVCAATMLTGLCAAPAFAVTDKTIQGSNNTAATGTSSVDVTATINISATVPTTLPISITNDTITGPGDFSIGNTLASSDTTLAPNALCVTISQKNDVTKKTVLTESSATGLNWTIGKSTDGTTATPLALTMDIKSGTLDKTFLSSYFTKASAFDVAWTIGLA